MTDPSQLRVAWFADIFDEVSGVITDTEEMYELAREQKNFLATSYHVPKPLCPFHCFPHIIKIPTGSFIKTVTITSQLLPGSPSMTRKQKSTLWYLIRRE